MLGRNRRAIRRARASLHALRDQTEVLRATQHLLPIASCIYGNNWQQSARLEVLRPHAFSAECRVFRLLMGKWLLIVSVSISLGKYAQAHSNPVFILQGWVSSKDVVELADILTTMQMQNRDDLIRMIIRGAALRFKQLAERLKVEE